MRTVVVVIAVAAFLGLGRGISAQEDMRPAGKVPFALGLFTAPGDTAVRDSLTVLITARGARGRGTAGTVRIAIPAGVTVVRGDTAFSTPLKSGLAPHELTIRANQPGIYEIGGKMDVVTGTNQRDFAEVSMAVVVKDGVHRPQGNVIRRLETSKNGKRFRFAGPWLVPMEDGETFDTAEFSENGEHPHVVESRTATCADCNGTAAVDFVVVVNRRGKVVQAQAMGQPSPQALGVARSVLSQWKFQPARLHGEPVTDWIKVTVPITSSTHGSSR